MWSEDQDLRRAALELYGAVWPHLPPGLARARRWGSDWFEVSTPFLVRSQGRILAHAGVVTCDLDVAGHRPSVAALHGVCVHPDYQGRGLGRQVIEDALAHVDAAGFETVILWSEKVDLYRRFGFEAAAESVFVTDAPEPVKTRSFRPDLEKPRHREALFRALRGRKPVSRRGAAADDGWHFLIDLALWAGSEEYLVALPDYGAVAVCEVEGSLARLYDVLGPEMPPCGALVAAARDLAGQPIERLEVYFTPDLLDVSAEPAPHPIEDVLMVRGKPLIDPREGAFALSPFTRT